MNASCGVLPAFLFTQEEKIEPNSGNGTFNSESSWKVPTSSHILMRASQVSSEFEQGDQSYLRLSLGQFFEQRSEALGCLGSTDIDVVKRVSISVFLLAGETPEIMTMKFVQSIGVELKLHSAVPFCL